MSLTKILAILAFLSFVLSLFLDSPVAIQFILLGCWIHLRQEATIAFLNKTIDEQHQLLMEALNEKAKT